MARDFYQIARKIAQCLPERLSKELRSKIMFWAPEIQWARLTYFVNDHIKPDSIDPVSVKIYALLCDKTEEDMKAEFIEKGF
ncbi:MAG: hypothetical protein IKG56_04210 [Clostridia bacterium]|nr:hypothetical protein [Clostridia bacterium]